MMPPLVLLTWAKLTSRDKKGREAPCFRALFDFDAVKACPVMYNLAFTSPLSISY